MRWDGAGRRRHYPKAFAPYATSASARPPPDQPEHAAVGWPGGGSAMVALEAETPRIHRPCLSGLVRPGSTYVSGATRRSSEISVACSSSDRSPLIARS